MNGGELFTHLVQRVHFKEQEVTLYSGEIVLALEHLHKVKIAAEIAHFFSLFIPGLNGTSLGENSESSSFLCSGATSLLSCLLRSIPHSAKTGQATRICRAQNFSKAVFTKRGREVFLMHACSVRCSHYSEVAWGHRSVWDLDSEINIVLVRTHFLSSPIMLSFIIY